MTRNNALPAAVCASDHPLSPPALSADSGLLWRPARQSGLPWCWRSPNGHFARFLTYKSVGSVSRSGERPASRYPIGPSWRDREGPAGATMTRFTRARVRMAAGRAVMAARGVPGVQRAAVIFLQDQTV
jgi:hypothetical protein